MQKKSLIKAITINTIMLASADHAPGQLVFYEPSWGTFPEDQGWVRGTNCGPARMFEDGWLVQHVNYMDCEIQPNFEFEYFRQTVQHLTGVTTFFVEWQSWTNGPPEELIYTAPSSMVASGQFGGASNHFTIASSQVRFIRDINNIPIVWADIDPEIPHVYRLEHYNDPPLWYIWTIDGVVVDQGTPEGPLPDSNAINYGIISFMARSVLEASTTRWRYIRAGEIPVSGSLDFTNDGFIDHLDYYLFRDYLSGPDAPHARGWSAGDVDEDADIDLADFAALQNHFTGDE